MGTAQPSPRTSTAYCLIGLSVNRAKDINADLSRTMTQTKPSAVNEDDSGDHSD